MSRTTTRDIIKVCADLARMDRKAKMEVFEYLNEELRSDLARIVARTIAGNLNETGQKPTPKKAEADKEGGTEQ